METDRRPCVLIVEDDDSMYKSMQRTLKLELQDRGLDVEVVRAANFVEAKRKMRETAFGAISTDMGFPMFADGSDLRRSAGSLLIGWARRIGMQTPFLVYSANSVEETRDMLLGEEIVGLPPIVPKMVSSGNSEWVKRFLEIMTK